MSIHGQLRCDSCGWQSEFCEIRAGISVKCPDCATQLLDKHDLAALWLLELVEGMGLVTSIDPAKAHGPTIHVDTGQKK